MKQFQSKKAFKNSYDVTSSSDQQIFAGDDNLDTNYFVIQNTGDTDLWVSLSSSATTGSMGEIKLTPGDRWENPYRGEINAIRESDATEDYNCTVVGIQHVNH